MQNFLVYRLYHHYIIENCTDLSHRGKFPYHVIWYFAECMWCYNITCALFCSQIRSIWWCFSQGWCLCIRCCPLWTYFCQGSYCQNWRIYHGNKGLGYYGIKSYISFFVTFCSIVAENLLFLKFYLFYVIGCLNWMIHYSASSSDRLFVSQIPQSKIIDKISKSTSLDMIFVLWCLKRKFSCYREFFLHDHWSV